MSNATCQHCDGLVEWTKRPADANHAAFAHVDTGTVACPAGR